jgi:hypothetical protein
MRRRDFTIGLLLAGATQSVRAQEPSKQHRIAIFIPASPVAVISETSSDALLRRLYQPLFEELRRLGDAPMIVTVSAVLLSATVFSSRRIASYPCLIVKTIRQGIRQERPGRSGSYRCSSRSPLEC